MGSKEINTTATYNYQLMCNVQMDGNEQKAVILPVKRPSPKKNAAPSPATSSPSPPISWACQVCTFINTNPVYLSCGICQTPRLTAKPATAPVSSSRLPSPLRPPPPLSSPPASSEGNSQTHTGGCRDRLRAVEEKGMAAAATRTRRGPIVPPRNSLVCVDLTEVLN
jgi:hypothetical protein